MRRVIAVAVLAATATLTAVTAAHATGGRTLAGGTTPNTGIGCCKH